MGRDEEQWLLTSILDEVATRVQALVLRGEPGIGKSRLLSDTARTARERGMLVLTTAGVQTEAHLPFAGLHQLLRPVRAYSAELPAVQRAALDAAFGLTHDVAPEQYRIAMAALDLVSEVAAGAPLLLVVEDAHWLDRPTSDVLAFVARRIESDPIILLAAAREGYPSTLVDAGLPELRLAGLDDVTAGTLLDAWAPQLPLADRTRVLRAAAGNPLALLELPAVVNGREAASGAPGGLPLTERLESDVEATHNVLDLQDGPAILVGHSYGGAVITEAGRCVTLPVPWRPVRLAHAVKCHALCGVSRAARRREESPMSSSMVNLVAIIVRRSGAMGLKPC